MRCWPSENTKSIECRDVSCLQFNARRLRKQMKPQNEQRWGKIKIETCNRRVMGLKPGGRMAMGMSDVLVPGQGRRF